MVSERTTDGLSLSLRPHGSARYAGALFLVLWLCGWAAGEAFALWMLGQGAIALMTGAALNAGGVPLQMGPALLVGGFLLVWLTIWTVGGVTAIAALLRMLSGEDLVVVDSDKLVLTRRHGPFRTTQVFDRSEIVRIVLAGTGDKLMLETSRRSFELSDLGTREERLDAAATLTAELGLAAKSDLGEVVLPAGWEDIVTPEGERALVSDRGTRRLQARTAGIAGLLTGALSVVFLLRVPETPALLTPAAILGVLTVAITIGALRLARGRWEWRIDHGRITLCKRYGSDVRDVFEAQRLALETSSDSDGDRWYELTAIAAPLEAAALAPTRGAKTRRPVARLINDAFAVHQLAHWLAHASGLPLDDRTTPAAREAELAESLRKLESSGWLGRQAARMLERVAEKRTRR